MPSVRERKLDLSPPPPRRLRRLSPVFTSFLLSLILSHYPPDAARAYISMSCPGTVPHLSTTSSMPPPTRLADTFPPSACAWATPYLPGADPACTSGTPRGPGCSGVCKCTAAAPPNWTRTRRLAPLARRAPCMPHAPTTAISDHPGVVDQARVALRTTPSLLSSLLSPSIPHLHPHPRPAPAPASTASLRHQASGARNECGSQRRRHIEITGSAPSHVPHSSFADTS